MVPVLCPHVAARCSAWAPARCANLMLRFSRGVWLWACIAVLACLSCGTPQEKSEEPPEEPVEEEEPMRDDPVEEPMLPPVYVTVGVHIEDNLRYTDCREYPRFRDGLVDFVEFVHSHGVPLRVQASYEWFIGAKQCETPDVMEATDGMSSLDYLVDRYGVAVDPHQEGAAVSDATSGNNFADIRWAGEQVTSHMSEVTGFQWDNPRQYEQFQAGERGLLHDYTWRPEILTGGVSVLHTDGNFSKDMTAMGVWVPSGFTEADFLVHDEGPDARMVYVGSGPNQWASDWGARTNNCHYERSADVVEAMALEIERGTLSADGIYTYTFFIPQKVMFDPAEWSQVTANLDQLAPLVERGQVEYKHYEDIVRIWEERGGEPFVLDYESLDPSLRTCL